MHTLRPFYAWCQKVLPLVYDDSLSYYELLCKVLKHLNMTIEDVNELKQIVTGGVDIQTIVEEEIDKMVEDGTFDAIVSRVLGERYGLYTSGARGTVYPNYDFSNMAKDMFDYYGGNLSNWDTGYTRDKWDNIVYENPRNAFEVDGWWVGASRVPIYVWKARKNYQTTHQGDSSENKFGSISHYYYGEKTFIVLMGERGSDKIPDAVFYHLFKEWLAGKYNGEYILDNYNFIIVPMINYAEYATNSMADSLHNRYNNGFTGFNDSTETNDAIEDFLLNGIAYIVGEITGYDLLADFAGEPWRFNQKIVMFNLREFSWGVRDDEDLHDYGMIVRGHHIREEHSADIIYDASMQTLDMIKDIKPELYAGETFSQVHIGPLARHSLGYAGGQFGYKVVSVEMPARVGATYSDINTDMRATENSLFLGLTWFYNVLTSAMTYLDQPVKRVYGEMMQLGFFTFNEGIDTDGEFTGQYHAVDVDTIIECTPPGAYCSFAIPALTYIDGDGNSQLFDMSKEYLNLPSTRSGELHIRRGGNNYSNDASRGVAIYTPYYDNDKWYYCKVYHDGSHSAWFTMQARTSMEYCIARSDNENAVTTTDGDMTKIPLNQADHQWSTIGYFGISDGGIHIRKHGLYLVSGGVQLTAGASASRLASFVLVGTDWDHAAAVAGEAVPDAAGSFIGGIACSPRIVEIQAERWLYLGCRTTGDDGSVTRNGANTFLQALLVRELD